MLQVWPGFGSSEDSVNPKNGGMLAFQAVERHARNGG
jgi:hypothetical protein